MHLRQHPVSAEGAAFWADIRKQFYLRDDTTYLQGGSVGPSSRPTIERTIDLLRLFESDPLNNRHEGLLRPIIETARSKLARFVGADPDRLALLPNTTMGINLPAQGLPWEIGREILMSDQEYPAVKNLFDSIADRDGLTF
ncbi:MAG: aminotransferase class V-fold PLP-dependent enzyme, partial [Candidatus Latescibacteria bacterium]|nr:aminotransferase class V-fold PLP-dependent enzyme [Candidatus Latescibacterota bacterium]